ncbi:MAG: nucleotidyltransferase family protein [Chloroflexi bacterium]|nr:nucleotidyltransferase family protein [Chloroflexota bacterium]
MRTLEEIRKILVQHRKELERSYGVKELGIFGSYARSQQSKKSDIDILVDFEAPVGLFKFMELEEYLKDLLGMKVDLVTKEALKPHIGEHILREVSYL